MPQQKIVIETPEGKREYSMFMEGHSLGMAYRNREVKLHDDIFYRGVICEIIGEFRDEDGVLWPTLLAVSQVQGIGGFV